ncbi:hypothetical protein XHC_3186 [Xanthomonas hortorum pv. carotae str. M081]|nr:hypothetical protein XHC_3186 [Xanthomonas hortorum pv. carotae str. M081]
MDRHVPTAEVDHLGAERTMGVVEDGLLGHARRSKGKRTIIAARPCLRERRVRRAAAICLAAPVSCHRVPAFTRCDARRVASVALRQPHELAMRALRRCAAKT